MYLLWRSWSAFLALLMTVLTVLAILSVLQHNSVLSDLIRQRLSVVVQSVETSFNTVTELGLPLSMMRNADALLLRTKALDPDIEAIHVFNSSGIAVHSTDKQLPTPLSREELTQQNLSKTGKWSQENDHHFFSYASIANKDNATVGTVVVLYPKKGYNDAVAQMIIQIITATISLLLLFSVLGFIVFRFRLSEAIKGAGVLKQWAANKSPSSQPPVTSAETISPSEEIDPQFIELRDYLIKAEDNYQKLDDKLLKWEAHHTDNPIKAIETPTQIVMSPLSDTVLGRSYGRKLLPWVLGMILTATLTLGFFTYNSISHSLEPEMAKRTDLIAQVATENIQRSVSAGVPLEYMAGLEGYFDNILINFPEISFFGVATGKFVFKAGNWQYSLLSTAKDAKDVPIYPIVSKDEEIGYIIIRPDFAYIAKQFREVALDLSVVVLVVLLLAYEIMIIVMTMSLTSPLNRLKHLARLQAGGDFSSGVIPRRGNLTECLIKNLSDRTHTLHQRYLSLLNHAKTAADKTTYLEDLKSLAKKYKLSTQGTRTLTFPYINDIRLSLFLFAAADELALSFFPLFIRAAENPLTWIDPAIVISLPIAGYLLAYMLAAPFSRTLTRKWGHKNLILGALAFVFFSNFGMFFATNVLEIIFYRSLGGVGYALAVLTCQDYVIDFEPKNQRTKSLGIFSAALFGGIFSGTALGGVLADRFGTSTAFMFSVFLVLLSAFLVFRMIPKGLNITTEDEAPLKLKSIIAALKNPRFFAVCMGLAVPQKIMDQAFIYYIFSLQLDALNASTADIGRMLMVYFLMIMLSGTLLGWLRKINFDEISLAIIGSLITGAGLLATAALPSQLTMLLAAASTGFGHGLIRGPQVELTMKLAEGELRHLGSNSVLGALRLFERGGSILGLLIIAAIAGYLGLSAAIGTIGILILVGMIIFVAYYIGVDLLEALSKRKLTTRL